MLLTGIWGMKRDLGSYTLASCKSFYYLLFREVRLFIEDLSINGTNHKLYGTEQEGFSYEKHNAHFAQRILGRRGLSALAVASPIDVKVGDGIARVGLSKKDTRNALGRDMIRSLRSAVADIGADSSIIAVVFFSSVPKVFCAGADLKERVTMTDAEVSHFVSILRQSFVEIEQLPMPTIAALDGAALGGGLELALSCDIRVGGTGVLLGLVETKLGIIPGAGGTQRLPRLIGIPKAKELIFTGKRLDGATAYNLGILNHFVAEGSAFDKSMEIAKEISLGAPLALRAAKTAINEGINVDIATGMIIEKLCYAQVIKTEDRLEGIRAFAEKRTPQYKGR